MKGGGGNAILADPHRGQEGEVGGEGEGRRGVGFQQGEGREALRRDRAGRSGEETLALGGVRDGGGDGSDVL